MSKKHTTEYFIEKAKIIHNNLYDYKNTIYINVKTKLSITCNIHGDFMVAPSNHLSRKSGCPKCAILANTKAITSNIEEFVKKAKKIHEDKYIYGKTIYINCSHKLIVECRIHGDFNQMPSDHLSGYGCPKCGVDKNRIINRLTTEEYIERANKTHNNKYDYSKIEYKTSSSRLLIICPTHGEFTQVASHHTTGNGCQKCGVIIKQHKTKMDIEEFILKCTKNHFGIYDYSLIQELHSIEDYVKIICKKHGIFSKKAKLHLVNGGCPKCILSKGALSVAHYLKHFNINYEIEKSFPTCKFNDRRLRFDFFVEDRNLLIEYDGHQHFMITRIKYDSDEKLNKRILYDTIKNEWATKNGYRLLRIHYNSFNEIHSIIEREYLLN
jgi:hypothetical protein